MAAPNRADPINGLNRKDQSTIFRLRTQHIALNKHLHRIGAITTPACPLCNHPEESVDHHLYHCTPLNDLRNCYLPPQTNRKNLLYGSTKELKNICIFDYMAIGRRANKKGAQTAAG